VETILINCSLSTLCALFLLRWRSTLHLAYKKVIPYHLRHIILFAVMFLQFVK